MHCLSLSKADLGNKEGLPCLFQSSLSWSRLAPPLCKKDKEKQDEKTNKQKTTHLESKSFPSEVTTVYPIT